MMFRRILTLVSLTSLILLVATMVAVAIPPSPEAKAKFIAEGTWDKVRADLIAFDNSLPSDMYEQSLALHQGRYKSQMALSTDAVDTVRVAVILVEFPDFRHDDAFYPIPGGDTLRCHYAAEKPEFDSLLFSVRGEDAVFNPTGSWTDFYLENSYGTFFIQGDVFGWVMAPNNYSFYVGDNSGLGNGAVLANHACAAAEALGVDFSVYGNGGSMVPGVVIVHAGPGAEQGAYGIWSHRSNMSPSLSVDGVTLSGYTMQPEEQAWQSGLVNMGVFAHEYGHVLGLQDWYDPSYQSEGLGDWCIMAGGSWNLGGQSPAHFNCYSKYLIGFNDLQFLDVNILQAEIPPVATSPVAYALRDGLVVGEGSVDTWFVENRQKIGFDAYLPGEGLLIYHFDALGTQFTPSGAEVHLLMALEEADGDRDLERNINSGEATDPWPGAFGQDQRHFHDYSVPNSNTGEGATSQVSVLNISDSDSIMHADLGVVWAIPWPELAGDSITFSDVNGGDGDGIMEQGETIEITVQIANRMRLTFNPFIRLVTSNPDLQITANTKSLGIALNPLVLSSNYDPIIFTIPNDYISSVETFTFTIYSDSLSGPFSGDFQNVIEVTVPIGKAQIMLVDDDNNRIDDRRFTDALDRLGYPFVKWDKFNDGSPTYADMAEYAFVFWMTGSYRPPSWMGSELTVADVTAMKTFMDNGGNLLLGSYSAPGQLQTLDSAFMADYLKANLLGSINRRYFLGVENNPMSDGLFLFAESNGVEWDGITPTLTAVNGGQEAFVISNSAGDFMGDPCGVTFDGAYRSVFLSFGVEMTINYTTDIYNYVVTDSLVNRIIKFFASGSATGVNEIPGDGLLPVDFALEQNYPNPFNPSTEIVYSIGPGLPQMTNLSIFNVLGQKVTTLVNQTQGVGQYTVSWTGRNSAGNSVASGVYFYRLSHGEQADTRKMILMK